MSYQSKFKSIKTFNDPVYGFITIDDELIFKLIEHPFFQRLRRISQLGLTNLVYSGANHSRFQHALGAMNLMRSAIAILRSKGEEISIEDERGAKIAILLHDVGHGPFSHALESSFVSNLNHEEIGLKIMHQLNLQFNRRLDVAISIFNGTHKLKYLHQLVSSQLDVDRLDYIKRDSFFTGVSEGSIGSERIIKMMCTHKGSLAVESKALYSLEKFLLARRLMYWQVYLHKAVLSSEFLIINILKRAKYLCRNGVEIWADESLAFFLKSTQVDDQEKWIETFAKLDDTSIMYHIKAWQKSADKLLQLLCNRLIDRRLLKAKQIDFRLNQHKIDHLRQSVADKEGISIEDAALLVFQKSVTNIAYDSGKDSIFIQYKTGPARELSESADLFHFSPMKSEEIKHYIYYPEEFELMVSEC